MNGLNSHVRWIGFDMDECIASAMSLYTFLTDIPMELSIEGQIQMYPRVMYAFASLLFKSEMSEKTHILRPAMIDVLKKVWEAHRDKKIEGAFIFSNNGSKELVNFMGFFLNVCIWNTCDKSKPIVFKMCVWQGAPYRNGLVKDYASIQTCLHKKGLKKCSSKKDLLFFDDLDHVLHYEIPHYIRVPPYENATDIDDVIQAVEPLSRFFTPSAWKTIVELARECYIGIDIYTAQKEKYIQMDKELFIGAIQAFLI